MDTYLMGDGTATKRTSSVAELHLKYKHVVQWGPYFPGFGGVVALSCGRGV